MNDPNWQLTVYLGKTTIDAAAAGLQLIDWLTTQASDIKWTLANGRIQFRAAHPFCTLHPKAAHLTCRIHQNGRAHTHHLTNTSDLNKELQHHIWQAYQEAK